MSFCGRQLTPQELDLVRHITREFATLALTELAHTVCELLEWRRPNGTLKSREGYLFLQTLHHRGWLPWLPPPQARTRRPRITVLDPQSEVQSPLTGALGDYLPLRLQVPENREDHRLFQQYIQRYHYLAYRVPYGAQLRYFVRSQRQAAALQGVPVPHPNERREIPRCADFARNDGSGRKRRADMGRSVLRPYETRP